MFLSLKESDAIRHLDTHQRNSHLTDYKLNKHGLDKVDEIASTKASSCQLDLQNKNGNSLLDDVSILHRHG